MKYVLDSFRNHGYRSIAQCTPCWVAFWILWLNITISSDKKELNVFGWKKEWFKKKVYFVDVVVVVVYVERSLYWERPGVDFTNVYEQFFCTKIPKVQKDIDSLTVFLHFWDLHFQKLFVNMLVKWTLVVNFINILLSAFAPISFCQKVTKPNCN